MQAWETEFREVLFGTPTKEQPGEPTKSEIDDNSRNTTQNEQVKTTEVKNLDDDKTSSDNNTSFNLDISDNTYILMPPSIERPPQLSALPPMVDASNPRKVGRYILRPYLRPNANSAFRMLDSVTTEALSQTN